MNDVEMNYYSKEWRARRLAEQQAPRQLVPFDPTDFDKYVGYYELSPIAVYEITRDGDNFFSQAKSQGRVRVYPESKTKFFATVMASQISFVTDAQGIVTELILHQRGAEWSFKRIDEATAESLAAAHTARLASNTPSPGTEDILRRYIISAANGQPNYDDVAPQRAEVLREQWPSEEAIIKGRGALKSIAFVRVDPRGTDVYHVDYQNGRLEWSISPLGPDGKVALINSHTIP